MKVLLAVCLILGCFLGAGFVSGREVASYFSRFGNVSYVACIIAGFLFFILTYFFFKVSNRVRSTNEFISCYFKKGKGLVELLFAVCILIITGTMIAGTYSLADSLGYNQFLIVGITMLLAFFVVKRNVRGLEWVNVILVPILMSVLLFAMKDGGMRCDNGAIINGIVSGSSYVFINIVSLGLLIIEIGHKYSKREKFLISLICSVVIVLLLIVINFSILSNGLIDDVMPILVLSSRNSVLYITMQISMYLGLFTTLISNIFLLSNFISKYISSQTCSIIVSLMLSVFISCFGFNNLVGYIYLFIAGVGVFIVVSGFKKTPPSLETRLNS